MAEKSLWDFARFVVMVFELNASVLAYESVVDKSVCGSDRTPSRIIFQSSHENFWVESEAITLKNLTPHHWWIVCRL